MILVVDAVPGPCRTYPAITKLHFMAFRTARKVSASSRWRVPEPRELG
jgi:hypothetical protein